MLVKLNEKILKRWNVENAASKRNDENIPRIWWKNRIEAKIMKHLFPRWSSKPTAFCVWYVIKAVQCPARNMILFRAFRFCFCFLHQSFDHLRYMPLGTWRVYAAQTDFLLVVAFVLFSLLFLFFQLALQNHWLPHIYSKSISIFLDFFSRLHHTPANEKPSREKRERYSMFSSVNGRFSEQQILKEKQRNAMARKPNALSNSFASATRTNVDMCELCECTFTQWAPIKPQQLHKSLCCVRCISIFSYFYSGSVFLSSTLKYPCVYFTFNVDLKWQAIKRRKRNTMHHQNGRKRIYIYRFGFYSSEHCPGHSLCVCV